MSDITTAQEWRAFLSKPGAKALIKDVRWLLSGCPTCDCQYWLISSDGQAYCEGCGRGFGFAIGACPVSLYGAKLMRYDHRSLESSEDAIWREDAQLADIGLARGDFAPAKVVDVSQNALALEVVVSERPSVSGGSRRQPSAKLYSRPDFRKRGPDKRYPSFGVRLIFSLTSKHPSQSSTKARSPS
jgi:hypothetical protein